jgi:hypothetical protein
MIIMPIDFALKFQCVVSKFILEFFSTYQNLRFHLIIQNLILTHIYIFWYVSFGIT